MNGGRHPREKFIASCSFGKDSLATILLALKHREPLDEAVYCEVMFDRNISGEVPEHRDFIYGTAVPALEMQERITGGDCPSYDAALGIIMEYVNITGPGEPDENMGMEYGGMQ